MNRNSGNKLFYESYLLYMRRLIITFVLEEVIVNVTSMKKESIMNMESRINKVLPKSWIKI